MNAQHDESMLDLVAAYAVGAIDASTGECAMVRAHIAKCPICREEYQIDRAAAAALALSAAQTPPAALRERILAALPAKVTPIVALRAKGSSWFVPAAAAAALVIAAGLWWNAHRSPPQSWAASCVPSAVGCRASGTVTVAGAGRLHVQISGLASLPRGKQYQAWMIAPGAAPKPEPAFSADENGSGSVDLAESPVKGTLVAITVEPAGGSQAPTSKPFLVAKID